MREFPEKFAPVHVASFVKLRFDRIQCYLRQDIYEYYLKGEFEDSFDLEIFKTKYDVSKEDLNKMVENVSKELTLKGWGVTKGLGGTGLFVYDPKKPPKTANWT